MMVKQVRADYSVAAKENHFFERLLNCLALKAMRTKAHDMFVIPLCRQCHDKLHANTAEWEEENGSQLLLAMRTMDSALAMGVIATGKAK